MTIPIKKINLRKLKMQLRNPFSTSFGSMNDREFFITEVADGEGNYGYGESVAFKEPWYTEETVQTNEHIMTDFLINILKDNNLTHPKDVNKLFGSIRRNNMAKSALEGAIWDLYAKRKNISLAQALGGTQKTIDVGISIGIKTSIDELLNVIEQALTDGYKRIKIKVKPGWDVNVLKEVRQHYPDIPLMVDANSAYTLKDLEHLRKFDEYRLMMIEQPLAHDDIVDHAKLQKVIETPICLDESIHSFDDARKAIALGSCKIINIKIGRVGGLSESKRIHDYCQANNIAVWCGGMLESGVGRAHNIALTSLPQFTLPGDTAGSANYWHEDIVKPEVIVQNGTIQVPDKPGIGYELNEEVLEKYTIDTKSFIF